MSSSNIPGIGSSRYRQVRLTITQELSGRLSYRILAKGLNDTWAEHHLVAAGSTQPHRAILSTEDAVQVILQVARDQMIPGVG